MSGKSCGKRKRRPGRRGSCGGKRKVRRLVLVPLVTAVVLFFCDIRISAGGHRSES